jgi:hypothetical protein
LDIIIHLHCRKFLHFIHKEEEKNDPEFAKKLAALIVEPIVIPRNKVAILAISFCADLFNRSTTPLSRSKLPNINILIRGGTEKVKLDVRVIAATNEGLEANIKKGTFREDLFYRLYVFPISLPDLKTRREDIPLLAEHFLVEISRRLGRSAPAIEPEGIERLKAHPWPGNVRELKNEMERVMALHRGEAPCVYDAGVCGELMDDVKPVSSLVELAP